MKCEKMNCIKRWLIIFCIAAVLILIRTTNNKESYLLSLNFLSNREADGNYITCSILEAGGLGNQMWRFASLYGLGKFTGRQPYFESQNFVLSKEMDQINLTEISILFPAVNLIIKNPQNIFAEKIEFAHDCCKFENPKKLLNINQKHLKISGDYLQSYKFFYRYSNEVKNMFECGKTILSNVNNYAKNLFREDNNLKLCVHIRRGDFLTDILLESTESFVIPALKYANEFLNKNESKNFSLIFIGNDINFVKNLDLNKQNFSKIYYPKLNNRGEDLCFGINYCDAMLLTASGSTYGWWMAYLMKSNGPVMYNSQVSDYGNFSKDTHDFEYFLPEWISLTEKDGAVVEEKIKWWHQRNNISLDLVES